MSRTYASNSWSLRSLKLAAVSIGAGLLLAGCAGNPPVDQMSSTEAAINAAMTAGGSTYAPTDLKTAQDKQSQAKIEFANKNYDRARKLASEAEWDARVAERKSQVGKADKALGNTSYGSGTSTYRR